MCIRVNAWMNFTNPSICSEIPYKMYRKHSVCKFNPHYRVPSFINAKRRLITSQVEGCFCNFDRVNLKFHRAIIMKSLSKLETWRSLHIKVMELWSHYLLGSKLRFDCLLGFWHLSKCVLGTVFMCRNNYIRANTRISKIHPIIYLDAHPSICRGFLDCRKDMESQFLV